MAPIVALIMAIRLVRWLCTVTLSIPAATRFSRRRPLVFEGPAKPISLPNGRAGRENLIRQQSALPRITEEFSCSLASVPPVPANSRFDKGKRLTRSCSALLSPCFRPRKDCGATAPCMEKSFHSRPSNQQSASDRHSSPVWRSCDTGNSVRRACGRICRRPPT
jgi:hypothetical protein